MIATPEFSSRLATANEHLRGCLLCEHRCGADRAAGERGPCKAGTEARVFRHRVEYGEELELTPSHLFYLSGCDLRCKFCIAETNAFNPRAGVPLDSRYLSRCLAASASQRARNLQWVGGEPTIHIPAILEAMSGIDRLPPIVWKSDFHGTEHSFALLDGVVDTYVGDLKFGNNRCARRIAGIENYFEIVTRNIRLASRQGNLIVRHLLLPGHFDCCFRKIVSWIASEFAELKFSLRDGYLPRWQASRDPDLASPLSRSAAVEARRLAAANGLNLVN